MPETKTSLPCVNPLGSGISIPLTAAAWRNSKIGFKAGTVLNRLAILNIIKCIITDHEECAKLRSNGFSPAPYQKYYLQILLGWVVTHPLKNPT